MLRENGEPRQPAERRIQAVEVVATDRRFRPLGDPLATGKHFVLVPLFDQYGARFAQVGRAFFVELAQLLKDQSLRMTTMRTCDVIVETRASLEFRPDPALALRPLRRARGKPLA